MQKNILFYLALYFFLFSCSDEESMGYSKNFIPGEYTEAYISPGGEFILAGGETNEEYELWSAEGNNLWSRILPDDIQLESAALSIGAESVVIGAQSHLVRLLDENGNALWQKEFLGEMKVDMSDDGSRIFVAGSRWDTVFCYTDNGDLIYKTYLEVGEDYRIGGIKTTPNGERILLISNSDIFIVDKQGQVINKYDIASGNSLVDAVISHDGQNFVVSFLENDEYFIAYYNISGDQLWKKSVHDKWSFLAIDQFGAIYDAPREGNVLVWDQDGTIQDTIIHDESLSIDVSNSGNRLAISSFLGLSIIDME